MDTLPPPVPPPAPPPLPGHGPAALNPAPTTAPWYPAPALTVGWLKGLHWQVCLVDTYSTECREIE